MQAESFHGVVSKVWSFNMCALSVENEDEKLSSTYVYSCAA